MSSFSLTQELLLSNPAAFHAATQPPFLALAAQGRVPKDVLGKWLANDRLYVHNLIRGIGRLLSFLQLPDLVPQVESDSEKTDGNEGATTRLLNWLIDALVNLRDEEAFFIATARKYALEINLPADDQGTVRADAKLEGLTRFEALFSSLQPPHDPSVPLPWLEAAIVLWGTEKCYLEAWTRTRDEISADADANSSIFSDDMDGGALRGEFVPRWSTDEFAAFVEELAGVIDGAVMGELRAKGPDEAEEMGRRALGKWRELLIAERAFWPVMEA